MCCFGERDLLSAGPPLRVRDARPYSEEGPPRDVAVFQLQGERDSALQFSTEVPVLWQRVWLVARVAGGEPAGTLFHRATLVEADQEWMGFQYDNSKLDLTATSGAPVVDEHGRIIGINIGVKSENGKLIGVAQSARVVLRALEGALADAAQPGVATDGAPPRR